MPSGRRAGAEVLESISGDGAKVQPATDGVPTFWVAAERLPKALSALASLDEGRASFLLFDLFVFDDALTTGPRERGVTLCYELRRLSPHERLRLKVRVEGEPPSVATATDCFPNADWYERSIAARADVRFEGHPDPTPLSAGAGAEAMPTEDELDVDVALPRALAFERLLGIEAPPRAQAIRVLRSELLRVASHLFWYGAFVEAVGAVTPAFYATVDARRVLEVTYAIGGSHPERFVVGGVRRDLADDWRPVLESFLAEMRLRARDYAEMLMRSPTLQDATKGVSPMEVEEALAWGVTGPVLRATGLEFDVRKAQPYCGYESYDFEVPTGVHGDLYDRARVRVDELRQSLSILEQCVAAMPDGELQRKVPWILPPGEAIAEVESSRGSSACYVASDGGATFVHHRTPSFPHLQAARAMSRGYGETEASAILSSVDLQVGQLR